MRRIGPLLMSTMLVTGCAGLATNNESLRAVLERSSQSLPKLSAYDQGKRYLQFGRAGLAVDAFQTALRDEPDSVAVLNGLAVAYDRLGRGDVAQQFLDRALSVDPNSAVTLNNLAYLNLVQGNTAVALAYAERAKIAAALPMDMMLPDAIASAVDRNAEIASQVAISEKQERAVVLAPVLPRESDIKRVGLNEWELRIRPPNPADAVRINLPARDVAPRVIAPMAQPLAPSVVTGPLTGVAVVSPEIPDSVMTDLAIAPAEATLATEVAPQASLLAAPVVASLPVYEAPAADAIASLSPMIPAVPLQQLPEPARIEPMVAAVLPSYGPPAVGAIAALSSALPAIPEQPMPDAVTVEAIVAVLPTYAPPAVGAIAALSSTLPAIPGQPMPDAVTVEPIVAVLPTYAPPAVGAIAALSPVLPTMPEQPLPEPALVEPMVAILPSYALPTPDAIAAVTPAIPMVPPQQVPEPARVEAISPLLPVPEVPREPVREAAIIASLAVPAPAPRAILLPPPTMTERSNSTSPPETSPALAAPEAATRPVTPMIASVAPSRADTTRAVEPTGLGSEWRASLPASTVVRVSNGTGRRLMASRFARYFGEHGMNVRKIANANSFDYRRTVIFYNPDQRAQAEALAAVLPFSVRLVEAKQGRGQIELVLGLDLLSVDNLLRSA